MIIRVENHHFWKHWGKQNVQTFDTFFRCNRQGKPWTKPEFRASAAEPWQAFQGDQEAEWMVFSQAQSLNAQAAKLSISMGLPQIMGSNHAEIGYDSAEERFDAFTAGERAQLIGLFDFIQGPYATAPRLSALQKKNFVAFAELYHGSGQAAKYGVLIEGYYDAFRTLNAA